MEHTTIQKLEQFELDMAELLSIFQDQSEEIENQLAELEKSLLDYQDSWSHFLSSWKSDPDSALIRIGSNYFSPKLFDQILLSDLKDQDGCSAHKLLCLMIHGEWKQFRITVETFQRILSTISGTRILDLRRNFRENRELNGSDSRSPGDWRHA